MRTVVNAFASAFDALRRCEAKEDNRPHWDKMQDMHIDRIDEMCKLLPHGSGFDNGSTLDFQASKPERLVFNTSFHHMDEYGSYNGWTHYTVIVTPSLVHGFNLRVTGKDRNNIKEYIADTFHEILNADAPE